MTLEQQVISLDIAKRLKELGVRQDIEPYDAFWSNSGTAGWRLFFQEEQQDLPHEYPYEWCRAFTVAELGEMLPVYPQGKGLLEIGKRMKGDDFVWYVGYFTNGTIAFKGFDETSEADARGKCLIYLLENGLLKG